MTRTRRTLLTCSTGLKVLCLLPIAGCGGSGRDYPKVNPAAEVASSVKMQVTMLPTLASQGPQAGKLGVEALLQTLNDVDEHKAGEYWATLQEVQKEAEELKALYDGSGPAAKIQQKITNLGLTAQSLPDDMNPRQQH